MMCAEGDGVGKGLPCWCCVHGCWKGPRALREDDGGVIVMYAPGAGDSGREPRKVLGGGRIGRVLGRFGRNLLEMDLSSGIRWWKGSRVGLEEWERGRDRWSGFCRAWAESCATLPLLS